MTKYTVIVNHKEVATFKEYWRALTLALRYKDITEEVEIIRV